MILNQTSINRLRQNNILIEPILIMIRMIRPSKHVSVPIIEKIHRIMCYPIYDINQE